MARFSTLILPAIAVLMTAQTVEARKPREIMRDCSAHAPEVGKGWHVEEIGPTMLARWNLTTSDRTLILSYLWLNSPGKVTAYLAQTGTSGANDSVHLSPMKPLPPEGVWLTVRGNGETFGPAYFGHHVHGRSSVEMAREVFLRMANGEKDMQLIIQLQDGSVLYDEALPVETLREMEARMVPLVEQVEKNRSDRDNLCSEVIILVH